MKITVKFFAGFRETAKADKIELELPDGLRGSDLFDHLIKQYPSLERIKHNARLAVNLEFKPMESVLKDGDEVVFVAPVCGGNSENA